MKFFEPVTPADRQTLREFGRMNTVVSPHEADVWLLSLGSTR